MDSATIGRKIKAMRKGRGLTLVQLSDATGLSVGYLSKIESGRRAHLPPISTLDRIADAFGLKVAWLLTDEDSEEAQAKYFILRKDDRKSITMKSGATAFREWPLANGKPGRALNPSLMEIPAENKQIYQHDGEEFYFILKGRVRLIYGRDEFILEEGDSIYFDTDLPHTGHSLGDESALALVMFINPDSKGEDRFLKQK